MATPTSAPTTQPTRTPTPIRTATPAPAITVSPSPTRSPASSVVGDIDCSGAVTVTDALNELRLLAGLEIFVPGPCQVLPGTIPGWADVDCSGALTPLDALDILRYLAGLSVLQSEPCLDIGVHV